MDASESTKLIYLARRAANVSREQWPRTWRSHAVFASKLPQLETQLDWVRYCNRVEAADIAGEPAALPLLNSDHDGVAVVASSTADGLRGTRFTAEIQALIDEDERRVFDMLTPHFSFFTNETIVKDGPLGGAALFCFLRRGEHVSPDDFDRRYREDHFEIAARTADAIPALTRGVLNHPVNAPLPLFRFDGISEYWFESPDAAARHLADGSLHDMLRDREAFCNMDSSFLMLTSVIHKWSAS